MPSMAAVEHVRDAQTLVLRAACGSPEVFEDVAHCVVGDVTVAGKLVGERAHVAEPLAHCSARAAG